jgi:hypothetical protein
MSDDKINLAVDVTGNYFNHWPLIKIYHNECLLFDGSIEDHQTLNFQLTSAVDNNNLKFIHYGKKFGEDGVWDSLPDASEQCFVNINDIKFENVSIGSHLMSQLKFTTAWSDIQKTYHDQTFIDTYSVINSNGMMNFNGEISLSFEVPILNWLIYNKYKVPETQAAYFSNYSLRWHYEEDLQIIKEIKEILNYDPNSNN